MTGRGYFSDGINEVNYYLAAVGAEKTPGVTAFNMNARKSTVAVGSKTPVIDSAVDLIVEAEATASSTTLYVRAAILMEEIK